MKNFVSIRTRLLLGVLGFTLLSLGVTFWWFYTFTEQAITKHLVETAQDIFSSVDVNISADDLETLIRTQEGAFFPGSANEMDLRYRKIVKWLQLVGKVDPRVHAYIYYNDNGEIHIVAASTQEGSALNIVRFKELYTLPDEIKVDYLRGLVDIVQINGFKPYAGRFGDSLTAVGPIKNADGKVVAGIAVEINAAYLYTPLRNSLINLVFVIGLALIVLTGVIWLITAGITRSISVLTTAASQIRSGNYEVDMTMFGKLSYDDEISATASVFQIMVDKIYKREEALKKEVQELQIIIDETLKSAQVKLLTDTDFFRDLQTKAQHMRNRREHLEKN